jgi:hypothetical protein
MQLYAACMCVDKLPIVKGLFNMPVYIDFERYNNCFKILTIFQLSDMEQMDRNSVVVITTCYRLDVSGIK